jgi:anti-sigma factor RsiW
VPEHQQLSVLRQVLAGYQDSQAEYPADQQVDALEQHPASQPSPRQACWRQHRAAPRFRTALRQGIAQRVHGELDAPRATVTDVESRQIRRKPVLGGLINEYTHAA